MTVELSSDVMDALLAEAARAAPCECCGILLGAGMRIVAIVPAANVHPDPRGHFEIDPRTLIDCHRTARGEADGTRVFGYYHSHPNGLARPSVTDMASASGDGRIWAIVAAGGVSFWRDGEAGFTPLSYLVNER